MDPNLTMSPLMHARAGGAPKRTNPNAILVATDLASRGLDISNLGSGTTGYRPLYNPTSLSRSDVACGSGVIFSKNLLTSSTRALSARG